MNHEINEYLAASELARKKSDWVAMMEMGGNLERLGAFRDAWELLADAPLVRKKYTLPEWEGECIADLTLLVERRIRHIGSDLRMARFLNNAASICANVIASVDQRLVPLLSRSFPQIRVVGISSEPAPKLSANKAASYERLALYFGSDAEQIRSAFKPLVPNPSIYSSMRSRYDRGSKPIVGIAWHSTNQRKQLPGLQDWAIFLNSVDANYVSLQYDDKENGVDTLSSLSKLPIQCDEINQMLDIDGFASQVAAVDIVVTISNTTAYMAGALGIPCIVLLDDVNHLTWPANGRITPFYPSTHLVRRQGRDWREVIATLEAEVALVLSQ